MSYNIRLCVVHKRNDFEGYGFNLHSEANKAGQYIGHVEPKSPAEHAGLFKNDYLVEVNGFNVCDENHQQVVSRIKEKPASVELLVIDSDGYHQCKKQHIEIKRDMATIEGNSSEKVHDEKPNNDKKPKLESSADKDRNSSVNMISNDSPSFIHSSNTPAHTHDLSNNKNVINELTINDIKAISAEKGAKKRGARNNPNSFKERANLFDQL